MIVVVACLLVVGCSGAPTPEAATNSTTATTTTTVTPSIVLSSLASPTLPTLPSLSTPTLPTLPSLSTPTLPTLPSLSTPTLPSLPSLSTPTLSSSISGVSNVVSGVQDSGKGVMYSVSQHFSYGTPNATSGIGNVVVSQSTLPFSSSPLFPAAVNPFQLMRDRTNQKIAAMRQQHLERMAALNAAIANSHASITAGFRNMFTPFNPFLG